MAKTALFYPSPGAHSLTGAVALGYNLGQREEVEDEKFALEIETANTTGWRALQRRLLRTRAHALLAQETWLTPDAVPAASAWAKRHGWKSVWTAANPGPHGGASGGAAVFLRDHFGLRYPPGGSHVLSPGRVVAAVADVPDHRPLLLVSMYLVHGVGAGSASLAILADTGRRIQSGAKGYEVIVGGDFNMEPPELASTGFMDEMDLSRL